MVIQKEQMAHSCDQINGIQEQKRTLERYLTKFLIDLMVKREDYYEMHEF